MQAWVLTHPYGEPTAVVRGVFITEKDLVEHAELYLPRGSKYKKEAWWMNDPLAGPTVLSEGGVCVVKEGRVSASPGET